MRIPCVGIITGNYNSCLSDPLDESTCSGGVTLRRRLRRVVDQSTQASELHSWKNNRFRLGMCIVIFAAVTLIAACIGCIISVRMQESRKKRQEPVTSPEISHNNDTRGDGQHGLSSESSEGGYQASRTAHILHHNSFVGRELSVYKAEKSKRSNTRTNSYKTNKNAISLPVHARLLRAKIDRVVRSLTMSNPESEADGEPASMGQILEDHAHNKHHGKPVADVTMEKPREDSS